MTENLIDITLQLSKIMRKARRRPEAYHQPIGLFVLIGFVSITFKPLI